MATESNTTRTPEIVSFPSGSPWKKSAPIPKGTVLSFVKKRKVVRGDQAAHDFWSVSSSDDYMRDCDAGRLMAIEYLNFRLQSGFLPLQWIARDMREHKKSGLDIGFMSAIGQAADIGVACLIRFEGDLSRLKPISLDDAERRMAAKAPESEA